MAQATVKTEQIADGAITAAKIADGAIVAAELASNSVTTAKIAADAITGAKIADDAIDSEHYTDGSIDTAHITDANVTVAKMAANSVDSNQYVDGSIDTVHIADSQITVAKMAANSIDSAQYVDGSIDTAHYADNSITGAELADNIVIAGTLGSTGKITADAGIDIDNFNIDGTTIALSSGNMTIDVAGSITLDSDTGVLDFSDGGTNIGRIENASSDFKFESRVQDKDIVFVGNDGGTGIEAMRIDMSAGGKVGIGTASPSHRLTAKSDSNTNPAIKVEQTGSTDGWGFVPDNSNGNLEFSRIGGGTAGTHLTITNAGDVGIGVTPTSSYEKVLHIHEASGSSAVHLTNNTTGSGTGDGIDLIAYEDDFYIWSRESGGNILIGTAASERMRIDSAGNVLVGKAVTAVGTQGIQFKQDGEAYSTIVNGLNTWHVYANSGYRFYVNPNGGIYNYSGNNSNLSDEREKKNIEALESQWDSLKLWSLKKFHYNADDNSENKKYGVIAQEVETHNPEVISEFEVDDDTTRKAVKEQQMMWLAIKALQEAMTRIETLEAKVQTLEDA